MNQGNHWTILGAGAIGCLWAAYWRKEGCPVTLISHYPTTVKTLSLNKAETEVFPVYIRTANTVGNNISHLLITTKAHQTKAALASIKNKLSPSAHILILQNGMSITEQHFFADQKVYAATTTDGAYCNKPFHVTHAGQGETLVGAIQNANAADTRRIIPSLPKRLTIKFHPNIQEKLWQKLAINCAINGLTVKYQCRNGELLSNPEAYLELTNLCKEIALVTMELGLGIEFEALQQQVEQVLTSTAKNINSMLQDYRNKKPTEVEELNGYLYRQAKRLNIPCPLNLAIIDYVQNQTD